MSFSVSDLLGTWSNDGQFAGHGWNMIALPFGKPGELGDYRLLLNQYNENLVVSLVDKTVPNRGPEFPVNDQIITALQYIQSVTQIAATDAASLSTGRVASPVTPNSGNTSKEPLGIHHEPGLFLQMLNEVPDGNNLARLGTVPHGDSILALGALVDERDGPPDFDLPVFAPLFEALPEGAGEPKVSGVYFAPYFHFTGRNTFQGLFDPTNPKGLFEQAVPGDLVASSQAIFLSTTTPTGGIHNIPFVTNHANATEMQFGLWLLTLKDGSKVLQYFQRVILEFLPQLDDESKLIRWPHISFNTMALQG